jgi:hypothetical protein
VRSSGGLATGVDERPRGVGRCSCGGLGEEKRKKAGVWRGADHFNGCGGGEREKRGSGLGHATRREKLGKGVGDWRGDLAARGHRQRPGADVRGRAACPGAQQGWQDGCHGDPTPATVPGVGG